jgi:hypothetical protein
MYWSVTFFQISASATDIMVGMEIAIDSRLLFIIPTYPVNESFF